VSQRCGLLQVPSIAKLSTPASLTLAADHHQANPQQTVASNYIYGTVSSIGTSIISSYPESKMLAARDQENLVYSHQTNAASKPLNQSIRGPQSKTPGRQAAKTPFKKSVNDENNPAVFEGLRTGRKALAKGDANRLQDKQQDGKHKSNAFVTPIGRGTLLRDV
jgi:hypothetical protein